MFEQKYYNDIALQPSNTLTQSIVRGWIVLYIFMTYVDMNVFIDM